MEGRSEDTGSGHGNGGGTVRAIGRYAFLAAILLFFAWGANGVFNRVKAFVLTHDQFMLQMTLNDKEAAWYTAMAVCLKRNTPKACKEIP